MNERQGSAPPERENEKCRNSSTDIMLGFFSKVNSNLTQKVAPGSQVSAQKGESKATKVASKVLAPNGTEPRKSGRSTQASLESLVDKPKVVGGKVSTPNTSKKEVVAPQQESEVMELDEPVESGSENEMELSKSEEDNYDPKLENKDMEMSEDDLAEEPAAEVDEGQLVEELLARMKECLLTRRTEDAPSLKGGQHNKQGLC